jgi:hypothetical protein
MEKLAVLRMDFARVASASAFPQKRRGREWSRREPSDVDEARKGELSEESESIEPQRERNFDP